MISNSVHDIEKFDKFDCLYFVKVYEGK